jgi:hypothetical protein
VSDVGDDPPAANDFTPSKGVAAGNWLTRAVTGLLSSRTSRRGFLVRSALAGSAFAVAGCSYGTKKGPAYLRITDCPPGSLCRSDGYTEFCCSINGGYNVCPPDSIPAGWWKADSSYWCHDGPRWYVDCNQICCGPQIGGGFCQGCSECRCGPACENRKVYCNYFRYGQCRQDVPVVGPIACRLSFCDTGWFHNLGCTGPELRDNATAGHIHPCLFTAPSTLPQPPPPTTTTRPPPTTTRPPPTTTTTTTTTTTSPGPPGST